MKPRNVIDRRHILILCTVFLAACQEDRGISSAQLEAAAKDKVRSELGLRPDQALFSTVWVGKSRNGETVLCGRVAGSVDSNAPITPRRFITSVEPPRWLLFEPVTNPSIPSQPGKFVEWSTACAGEKNAG